MFFPNSSSYKPKGNLMEQLQVSDFFFPSSFCQMPGYLYRSLWLQDFKWFLML